MVHKFGIIDKKKSGVTSNGNAFYDCERTHNMVSKKKSMLHGRSLL